MTSSRDVARRQPATALATPPLRPAVRAPPCRRGGLIALRTGTSSRSPEPDRVRWWCRYPIPLGWSAFRGRRVSGRSTGCRRDPAGSGWSGSRFRRESCRSTGCRRASGLSGWILSWAGIVPLNWLPPSPRLIRLVRFPISPGIVPLNWLSSSLRIIRLVRFLSWAGIVPLNWLPPSPRLIRLVRFPISPGIVPLNWLLSEIQLGQAGQVPDFAGNRAAQLVFREKQACQAGQVPDFTGNRAAQLVVVELQAHDAAVTSPDPEPLPERLVGLPVVVAGPVCAAGGVVECFEGGAVVRHGALPAADGRHAQDECTYETYEPSRAIGVVWHDDAIIRRWARSSPMCAVKRRCPAESWMTPAPAGSSPFASG